MATSDQVEPGSSPADVSWGYAPAEMYHARWDKIRDHLTKSDFVLVDWGSDAGWFSIVVAHSHPAATVISVEAGVMTDGAGLALHRKKLVEYGVTNNRIANTLFGPATFKDLQNTPSDYQFVLSVFHHMGDGYGVYLRGVEDWDNVFCDMIRGSGVTFLELPNEANPAETAHAIRDWYAGRKVEDVIRDALRRGSVAAQIECLGETSHGEKGTRLLYKISLDDPKRAAAAADIAHHIEAIGSTIKERPYQRLRRFASHVLNATTRRGKK
jgi:hypothetical protein